MKYRPEQVAAYIDHAVLKADMTDRDIEQNAAMCIKRGVASMCVRPSDVKKTAGLLADSIVMTSCVLSFPHGADTQATKAFQATEAIKDGAEEIDMVMNIGKFLSGEYQYVIDDIKGVVEVAHKSGVKVKVIQESGYLTDAQIAKACELSYEAGADFVKTSTGFGPGSSTTENIAIMIKTVGDKMQVKPSGGIRTWETAVAYIEQGVDRLGVGSTEAVLDGSEATTEY